MGENEWCTRVSERGDDSRAAYRRRPMRREKGPKREQQRVDLRGEWGWQQADLMEGEGGRRGERCPRSV
jgi:hypothetical protein